MRWSKNGYLGTKYLPFKYFQIFTLEIFPKIYPWNIYMYTHLLSVCWLHECIHNKAIRDGKYLARHMPVLGNVHPIKIENVDFFSWRHFSARSGCYIINWYGYPRGSHEKYLKENCQSSFWDTLLNCYMSNVAHVKNDVKWRPIVTKFGTLIENMSRTGLYDCHIF